MVFASDDAPIHGAVDPDGGGFASHACMQHTVPYPSMHWNTCKLLAFD
jgi:hypothetical protein